MYINEYQIYVFSFHKCEHKALFFIIQAANLNLLSPLYCMGFYIYNGKARYRIALSFIISQRL